MTNDRHCPLIERFPCTEELLLRPGQLVLRRCDDELIEVVEVDRRRGLYRLADRSWARPGEVEDPLRASYRWDLERSCRAEALHAAVARGEFDRVFPAVAALRRRDRAPLGWAAAGWALAIGEGLLLAVILLGGV